MLLLLAFLSSPRSISKCGKLSKLLVKYPLCCGQSFYNTSCCGQGLFMTQILEWVHGGSYCNSVGLGQLEGKPRWLIGGRMVWRCIAAGCSLTQVRIITGSL